MMSLKLIEMFKPELEFIDSWLEYADADELEPLTNIDDACTQTAGMFFDYNGEDFPENLKVPEIMMMCWNMVIEAKKRGY